MSTDNDTEDCINSNNDEQVGTETVDKNISQVANFLETEEGKETETDNKHEICNPSKEAFVDTNNTINNKVIQHLS